MLKRVIGKKLEELEISKLEVLASEFADVMFDLGAGDGKFAYNFAKQNPKTFVVAVDADKQQFEDISHKANRKPAKGGLDNIFFIWSSIEDLPLELTDTANKVYINFPWGTLLGGVVKAEPKFLKAISGLLKTDGELQILTTYSADREPETIENLELPELSAKYIEEGLTKKYGEYGLKLQNWKFLDKGDVSELQTTWIKKLLAKRSDRDIIKMIFSKE